MISKTVYILGAGFSMDAGAPSQAKIVRAIFELKGVFEKKNGKTINEWIKKFDDFLKTALNVDDNSKYYYTLEDIYTPIDRSIADGMSFKNYTVKELIELRDIFNRLIILAMRNHIEKSKRSKDTIEIFARHIIALSKSRLENEKNDSVSIITTNWDIMLDNAANTIISKEKPVAGAKFAGVVDYCCYISSLEEHDHKIKPGLYAIGKKAYNLKILKLHGSLNWLQCPKCQRLYVKFYQKWNGGYVFGAKYCRHCTRNFGIEKHKSNQLAINLIMPTFLKNLNNVQNKLIWQNAGIELSEASKIVFLGYSLPHADFEFKQLLSRMIRPDAEIEAILIGLDDPDKYDPEDSARYQTAGYRFENFFSGRKLRMEYNGVVDYIQKL